MTIRIPTNTSTSVGLEDYLHFIEDKIDPESDESIMDSAEALRALSNNRSLIDDHLIDLLGGKASQRNPFSEQTILLGMTTHFTIRANFWLPMQQKDYLSPNDEFYSYNFPHDHNFSFLTVGYYGPGYETDLYEYSYDDVIGYKGEKVNLLARGKESLGRGDVMYYRSGIDVHTQLPPESLSISINLIRKQKQDRWRDQFEFCPESGTIVNVIGNLSELRDNVLSLGKEHRDQKTVSLLHNICSGHPCRRTCYDAARHLIEWGELDPVESLRICNSEHLEYVRFMVRREFLSDV